MQERGTYKNKERGRQLLLFDGFQYGNITPTDIDAIIEWKNRLWVIFEAKTGEKETPLGQRILFERFVQDMKKAGKPALAMIVEHSTKATEDAYLCDCVVREVFTTERPIWRPPNRRLTAKEAADAYLAYFEGKNAR